MNENLIDKIGKIQRWQYSSKHGGWIECEPDEGVIFVEDLRKAIEKSKAEDQEEAMKLNIDIRDDKELRDQIEDIIKNRLAVCSCPNCLDWAKSVRKVLST
jgi:hypothetical protein